MNCARFNLNLLKRIGGSFILHEVQVFLFKPVKVEIKVSLGKLKTGRKEQVAPKQTTLLGLTLNG